MKLKLEYIQTKNFEFEIDLTDGYDWENTGKTLQPVAVLFERSEG